MLSDIEVLTLNKIFRDFSLFFNKDNTQRHIYVT